MQNTLYIYVDKWYISGAVISSRGVPHRTILFGGEQSKADLYFYVNPDRGVSYGIGYREQAEAKETNYYTNIFDLVIDSEQKFYLGLTRADYPFIKIFEEAGLFESLHRNAVADSNTEVPIGITFSQELNPYACQLFLEELTKHKFKVIRYTIPLERLALEAEQRGTSQSLQDGGICLVVTATNDTLRYGLWKREHQSFRLLGQDALPGQGYDPRRYTLLKLLVQTINQSSNLLSNNTEIEYEIKRLSSRADEWLQRLDESRISKIPLSFDSISFSKAPNNKYSTLISKDEVDQQTQKTIDGQIGKINQLIKETLSSEESLSKVIFLGSIFHNTVYKEQLSRFYLGVDYSLYSQERLSNLVIQLQNVADDQTEAEREFASRVKIAQRNQNEMESKRTGISIGAEETTTIAMRRREAHQKYEEALRYFESGNYSEATIRCIDGLDIDPTHQQLLILKEEAQQKQTEEALRRQAYQEEIKRADLYYEQKSWEDALRSYEIARNFNKTEYVNNRIERLSRIIAQGKLHQEAITQVHILIEQEQWQLAQTKLNSISHSELNDSDLGTVSTLEELIRERINEAEQTLSTLETQIAGLQSSSPRDEHKGSEKLKLIEQIIALGTSFSNKITQRIKYWEEEKNRLGQELEKAKANKSLLEKLEEQMNGAWFEDKWEKASTIAQQMLGLNPLHKLAQQKLEYAQKKIQEEEGRRKAETDRLRMQAVYTELDTLASNVGILSEREIRARLRAIETEHGSKVKEEVKRINKLLFDLEFTSSGSPQRANSPIGFKVSASSEKKTTPNKPSSGKDFFSDEYQSNTIPVKKKITNDDFNF